MTAKVFGFATSGFPAGISAGGRRRRRVDQPATITTPAVAAHQLHVLLSAGNPEAARRPRSGDRSVRPGDASLGPACGNYVAALALLAGLGYRACSRSGFSPATVVAIMKQMKSPTIVELDMTELDDPGAELGDGAAGHQGHSAQQRGPLRNPPGQSGWLASAARQCGSGLSRSEARLTRQDSVKLRLTTPPCVQSPSAAYRTFSGDQPVRRAIRLPSLGRIPVFADQVPPGAC